MKRHSLNGIRQEGMRVSTAAKFAELLFVISTPQRFAVSTMLVIIHFIPARWLIAVTPPFGTLAKNCFDHLVEVDVWETISHQSLPVQLLQLGECLVPRTVTKLGARAIHSLALAVITAKDW